MKLDIVGRLGQVVLDLNAYYNIYKDFISTENVLVPFYGEVGDNQLSLLALQQGDFRVFQTYTNSPADVKSYGASLGLDTKVFGDYDLGANYTLCRRRF